MTNKDNILKSTILLTGGTGSVKKDSKGNYEKITTEYCDIPYENVYLVRTHHFKSVTGCPENYLTLYKL